jgi:predicted transcriptional regulator
MAKELHRKVVLMSIHPKFVDEILSGRKKVEFRKKRFSSDVSHVVVYATNPIKQVVLVFSIKNITVDNPLYLWDRYSKVAGICKENFLLYYKESRYGTAIEFDEIFKLDKPLSLSEIGVFSRPPQSYQYLDERALEGLCCGVSY